MSEPVKTPDVKAPETKTREKKRRYAPAEMGGRGHGPGPRGMERARVKDARGVVRRLSGYLTKVRLPLIAAILALIGSTVTSLLTPRVSGSLIDALNAATNLSPALIAAGVFGVYVSNGLFLSARLNREGLKKDAGKLMTEGFVFSLANFAVATAGGGAILYVSTGEANARLMELLLKLGGLYLAGTLLSLFQQLMLVRVAQHTVRVIRTDLFDTLQALPLRYFDSTPHGQLMSRLTNDVDNVSSMLSNSITQILSAVITLVMCLYMMLRLSWQLTLVSCITIPVSLLIARTVTKRTRKLFKEQQACLGELNGIVEETVSGARVVKVFCREENVIHDFDEANEELTKAGVTASILSSAMGPLMNVVHNFAYALMSGIGGFLVVSGSVGSIGMIQSFLQYSRQFANPFNQIANLVTSIQSALAGAERVFEVMDVEPEPADAPNADPLAHPQGHVEFRNVTFGYDPARPILKNVSFEAKPGQTIALVGPTGAGKTTVVNLLMRFYDIDSGDIFIDGINIRDIQRRPLRLSLGMVLQDVYLFAGTIRANIAYGRPDATDEQIHRAAKLANCEEFIERLPQGYDTELAEAGANLSQGQRQLLSIARAILADPSVLILDEATSSVDTRTEMHIQQAMLTLMKGRTSFVIAHRLSTIRGADQILVINGGEIIERGTHEQLLAADGFYANLLKSQYRSGLVEENDEKTE